MTFTPTALVVHYLATYEDQNPTLAQVEKDQRARGFREFAYHWYIDRKAMLWEGRPEHIMGAGARGHNGYTLHVVWAGGLNRATGRDVGVWNITPDQEAQLVRLIRDILERHPTIKRVIGHNNLTATQCPGRDDVAAWWASVSEQATPTKPATSPAIGGMLAAILKWLKGFTK